MARQSESHLVLIIPAVDSKKHDELLYTDLDVVIIQSCFNTILSSMNLSAISSCMSYVENGFVTYELFIILDIKHRARFFDLV